MARTVVAEDDADIREVVVLLLRRAGHHVTAVGDGGGALEALAHSHHDLVVTDHHMSRRTGAEVIEHVVVARVGEQARCLPKPHDARSLLEVVEALTAPSGRTGMADGAAVIDS